MKIFKLFLAGFVGAIFVTAGAAIAYDPGSFVYDSSGERSAFDTLSVSGNATLSGGYTLGADASTNGWNIVHSAPKTTDTAPDASSMTCGQSSYWNATAGTNATGGACTVSGGIGSRKDAIVAAAIVNDTLVITGTKGGVATSATWTFDAGGIGTCAALTNSQCAVLLVNYCNTNGPALGIASCECSDATCTTPTVGFIPAPDMSRLVLTPSDASQTVTSGANGQIISASDGTEAAPAITTAGFLTSGFSQFSGGMRWSVAGSNAFYWASNTFTSTNNIAAGGGITTQSSGVTLSHGMLGVSQTTLTLNNANKQTIFTVPAGKTARIYSAECRSASAALTVAHISFGGDANATDFLADTDFHTIFTGTTVTAGWDRTSGTAYVTYPATTVLGAKVNTTEPDAKTLICSFFGVLY